MLAWFSQHGSMIPDPPSAVTHGVRQVGQWLNQEHEILGVNVSIGKLLAAAVLLLVFMVGSSVLKTLLRRYSRRHDNISLSSVYTVERLVHYLLMAVGALWALSIAGVPMAKMTVFAGALGVGLGFGLQAIFNNFVSGLILLFERSLKVGDFVELASGVHGSVRDIYIRATRITTNDNIDILVPNSEFVNGRVVNWTLREAARRLKIPFGVAYGTDKERVKMAALEAAREVPFTLTQEGTRAPQVWLTGFGDSSLDFQLVVWLTAEATRRPGAVTAAYNWALHTALDKYGIEIPFPQRDLHVKSWPDREAARGGAPVDLPPELTENDAVRDVQREIAESAAPANDSQTHPADGKR
jgi:small-conductance mechanosensitive channel